MPPFASSLTRLAVRLGVALLVGGGQLPAEAGGGPPSPPPAVALPPSKVEVEDAVTSLPRREIHDVVHATLEAAGGFLRVSVRFRRPLLEGVYECLHAYVDCDADPKTGIDGADLWARGAVGSRYQRTNAVSPSGAMPAPASIRRSSWSRPALQTFREGPSRVTWSHVHYPELPPPIVAGADLSIEIPLALLAQHGLRYNRFIRVRLEAEGTCSEHPITLEYVCVDEGTPLRLDGRDDEWSGQPTVVDATGELHPDVAEVDIASLSVDHDAAHVFARVRLAAPGFGMPSADGDVEDRDAVTVALEPLDTGGRYMDYVERTVDTRRRSPFGVAGDGLVEFSIPRARQQTAFRVAVWADAIRIDKVPNRGPIEVGVPPEAFRPR